MTIHFIKQGAGTEYPERWYLSDKTWRGELESLRTPLTLNNFIEEITSMNTTKVSFTVSEFYVEGYDLLDKILNEEMEEGRYMSEHGEIFICDLIYLYFPSGYPNKIYYQIKDES